MAYKNLWRENPDGNYCYLVEYKGAPFIALVNEYYEHSGRLVDKNNYSQAIKAAVEMTQDLDKVIIAREQGCTCDGEAATEVVVLLPCDTDPEKFNAVSQKFAEIAY